LAFTRSSIEIVDSSSEYLVVIEKAENNYSAYSPDLPGCVATGDTKDEALQNIRGAIAMHIEGLREDGIPIPPPSTSADQMAV
jgi:predicted RNase H-like HicB family nuclease